MDSEVRPKSARELGVKFRDPLKSVSEGQDNDQSDGAKEARQSFIEGGYPSTSGGKPSKYEKYEREKIGHRRVTESGQVTYKKKPTSELMACIMLGIGQSIGGLSSKPERDLLMQDFAVVESVFFPSEGSNLTPAHSYSDFRFKTYAPMAFRYFRELFGIQPDDFLYSMCNEALVELSNPGASGSVFYITSDDEFIIKTLQHKEAEFLQKLLPGYYMNLNQNPRTLLPKFYGLYCYQCGGKNIRFVVMNNLLPSNVVKHEKYDLKGSTYKRKASKRECAKKTPTYKDLDFMEIHPEGISMEPDTYNALMKTLQRDGRVLESFKIMDYSLLLAVHNVDVFERENKDALSLPKSTSQDDGVESETSGPPRSDSNPGDEKGLSRGRSVKTKLASYSTPLESIHADARASKHLDSEDMPTGGIPAKNSRGERLLLFAGIIDILQNYRLRKKMEHTFKSIVHDGDTISVHRPSFYASRFLSFFSNVVFKKIPTPLKHSPSKKKSGWGRQRTVSHPHDDGSSSRHGSRHYKQQPEEQGAIGGRPDLLPAVSTPPPTFQEALQATPLDQSQASARSRDHGSHDVTKTVTSPQRETTSPSSREITGATSSITSHTTTTEYRNEEGVSYRAPSLSPAPSNCESTPTHTEFTEGTPSFTTSSASVYSDTLENSPISSSRSRSSEHHETTTVTTATHQSTAVGMVTSSPSPASQQQQQATTPTAEQRRSPSNSGGTYHGGFNDCEQHIVSPD